MRLTPTSASQWDPGSGVEVLLSGLQPLVSFFPLSPSCAPDAQTATELKAACEAFLSQVMGSEVRLTVDSTVQYSTVVLLYGYVAGSHLLFSESSKCVRCTGAGPQ